MIGSGRPGFNTFGSHVTLDTFNNRVFNHEVFSVSKRFTLASAGTAVIVIDPTENGAFPKDTFVFLPIEIQGNLSGPLFVDFYAGVDSDPDGTLWESTDRNLDNPETAHVVFRLNPTINSMGVKGAPEFEITSDGMGAAQNIGGSIKEDFIFVPRKDIRYAFEITNNGGSTANVVFGADWFEV